MGQNIVSTSETICNPLVWTSVGPIFSRCFSIYSWEPVLMISFKGIVPTCYVTDIRWHLTTWAYSSCSCLVFTLIHLHFSLVYVGSLLDGKNSLILEMLQSAFVLPSFPLLIHVIWQFFLRKIKQKRDMCNRNIYMYILILVDKCYKLFKNNKITNVFHFEMCIVL